MTLRSKVNVSWRSLRYATHRLMVMHPHTWMILFKKQLFDLEVKGQGPTKVITVHDTPPYGHAPTYQISLTYLERKKLWSGQASLRRSRRKNQTINNMSPFVRRGDIISSPYTNNRNLRMLQKIEMWKNYTEDDNNEHKVMTSSPSF